MPELGGVLGPVDVDRLAVEEDLALVEMGWIPAMHLISVDLPGAVVADEGHDLARGDVEVDFVEGLNRAEALRHSAQFEHRLLAHCCSSSALSLAAAGAPPRERAGHVAVRCSVL